VNHSLSFHKLGSVSAFKEMQLFINWQARQRGGVDLFMLWKSPDARGSCKKSRLGCLWFHRADGLFGIMSLLTTLIPILTLSSVNRTTDGAPLVEHWVRARTVSGFLCFIPTTLMGEPFLFLFTSSFFYVDVWHKLVYVDPMLCSVNSVQCDAYLIILWLPCVIFYRSRDNMNQREC
jgi:hypothetical protein